MEKETHPKRLNPDAILEAVLEIRFDSKEMPEIVIGRLTDHKPWSKFVRSSTPFASIPPQVRMSDPDMRFRPVVDLIEGNKRRNIKIGTNVISFHNLRPYLGWGNFYKEASSIIDLLFKKISGISVGRIGLRYINALEQERHHLITMSDLHFRAKINKENISSSFNFNYRVSPEEGFECLTRLATPDFVVGNLPSTTVAYVDVDVSTTQNYEAAERKQVLSWVAKARHHKNEAFFKLLPEALIEKLKEE